MLDLIRAALLRGSLRLVVMSHGMNGNRFVTDLHMLAEPAEPPRSFAFALAAAPDVLRLYTLPKL